MAQKRGLKKQEQDGSTPGATVTPNPSKIGRPRGSRKPAAYSIDLFGKRGAIDRIAELYGVKASTIIDDLTAAYFGGAFAPHFSKIQVSLAAERRQREEDALREIAPLYEFPHAPGPMASDEEIAASGGELPE